ncbi:rod-binding protein [Spirochaetia bacterium 38H-sp]|uniref:Rod-binding protein n=1 Tax=Rarispira pelagica TaxID=3141764 RepID=A0ABU9UAY6_9SPIR
MIQLTDLYKITDTNIPNLNPKEADKARLKEATQEFEAIFIKKMLDQMRKTVHRSNLIERNMAEDVFEDMLYDEYARKMAKTSSLGLADMLYKQLSRI